MATFRTHNEATKNIIDNRSSVLLAGDQMEELREKFVKVGVFVVVAKLQVVIGQRRS